MEYRLLEIQEKGLSVCDLSEINTISRYYQMIPLSRDIYAISGFVPYSNT